MSTPSYAFAPRYLSGKSSWTGHLPFAYDLVKFLRPALLVELSTWDGDSFFTFCQSVYEHALAARCYAVGHREGQSQTAQEDDTEFSRFQDYCSDNYYEFAGLMHIDSALAVDEFGAETIDLLHLDGLRTYEVASCDFARWLPKVRAGGVVLLHNISIRSSASHADCGVWKLWEEIKRRHRTFQFHHAFGLGVLIKNSNPDLESWVSAAMETPLRAHYIRRGIDLTLIMEGRNAPGQKDLFASQAARLQDTLAREQRALEERDRLRDERDRLRDERDRLRDEHDRLRDERDVLRDERDSLRDEHDSVRAREGESSKRVTQLDEEVEQLKITRFEAKRECYAMKTSFSWKLTWPLRVLRDMSSAFVCRAKHRILGQMRTESCKNEVPQLDPDRDLMLAIFDGQFYLEQCSIDGGVGSSSLEHYRALGWREGRDPHPLFSTRWYLENNPDIVALGLEPLQHYCKYGWHEGRDPHPMFSTRWYLENNPDIVALGLEPLQHYCKYGWHEGRDPHPLFSTRWYLENNPDIVALGLEPLQHYCKYGWHEGRDPHPLFSTRWYLENNPDIVALGLEPLPRYCKYGWHEGRDPHPLFSTRWYLENNPDIVALGLEPLEHYCKYGWHEGRDPHPLFNTRWYLENNPDIVALGLEPLQHYCKYGWREGRDPHALFNTRWYLENNPDIVALSLEPLEHYGKYGWREGRDPHPLFDTRYYRAQLPSLLEEEGEPLTHFCRKGARQGLNPNRLFDVKWYIDFNRPQLQMGENALEHYVRCGWREGFDPHPSFSISLYLEANPDANVRHLDPLRHYLQRSAQQSVALTPPISAAPPVSVDDFPKVDVRAIAMYLPQFHRIPENDKWWGEGFTEWTNVRRAKPQFWEHYQPHIPHSDIGYYDLSDESVLEKQAKMARQFGIHGFCFYYYWFNGKRLLQMPADRLLATGKPDFPFCFCWANENWTRCWDGMENEILIAQGHSKDNDERFILELLPAFQDHRYIRVNGRPFLVVYRPMLMADPCRTFLHWRNICRFEGIGEIYLAGTTAFELPDPASIGLDAAVELPPMNSDAPLLGREELPAFAGFTGRIYDYRKMVDAALRRPSPKSTLLRGVTPSWDNTPRRQNESSIVVNGNPEIYCQWLCRVINQTRQLENADERLVFINAWNEWAEGAHLEPDERYGFAWLNATRVALAAGSSRRNAAANFDEPYVLVVSHDAALAGAQMVVLNLLRQWKRRRPFAVRIICVGDGELRKEFEECFPTLVLADFADKAKQDRALAGFLSGSPRVIYSSTWSMARCLRDCVPWGQRS